MLKGGIKTAHNKSLKRSYKHLSKQDYLIMKKIEKYDQAEKELYGGLGFYKTCKRLKNGSVDFESLTEKELDWFEDLNKKIKIISKYSEKEILRVRKVFKITQFSYSQSF